jgi:hypothetical protein
VRRDWAEEHLGDHLRRWDRSAGAATRLAVEQRRERLAAWRRERAQGAAPDDRILAWIDRELARLADPEAGRRSTLLPVRVPRVEVRELVRRPATIERLLRLGWLIGLSDPETMPLGELKDALEARGYAADAAGRSPPAALDRLLPPSPEPEAAWLARRAATEVMIDSGLRFLQYQDLVIPDVPAGGVPPSSAVILRSALAELNRLLDPDSGQGRADRLLEKLAAVGAGGRVGAMVTRLAIAPDLGGVTVEVALWVRGVGGRWAPFESRTATVRAQDLRPGAGRPMAEDPQVQGAFRMIEGLGLGAIPPELKEQGLRIGAATQQALESARAELQQDLEAWALPVLEPDRDRDPRGAARAAPQPVPNPARPRRSMLGPPDR